MKSNKLIWGTLMMISVALASCQKEIVTETISTDKNKNTGQNNKVSVVTERPIVASYISTWRADKSEFGFQIFSLGSYSNTMDMGDPVVCADAIKRLQTAGVDVIINDLTNWSPNLPTWASCAEELPVIRNEIERTGMQQTMLIRAQAKDVNGFYTSISAANDRAELIWNTYAQRSSWFKYKGKPVLVIFQPSESQFWAAYNAAPASEKTFLQNFQIETCGTGGWGWTAPDRTASSDGNVRSVLPYYQDVVGNWLDKRKKATPATWESSLQWGIQAPEILVLPSYDEFSDGSAWANADGTVAQNMITTDPKYRLCNQYPTTDWDAYYNLVKQYCGLPSPWFNTEIGNPTPNGRWDYNNPTFTIKAGGSDVYGTSDEFNYIYQTLNGDGQLIAKVNTVGNTNIWAKAGLMIRASTSQNGSKMVLIGQRPDNQVFTDYRAATDGSAQHSAGLQGGTASTKWLKLVRTGNIFNAYYSTTSKTGPWIAFSTASMDVPMVENVTMGLFVTSHNTASLCTTTFTDVSWIK